jgi:regulator of protease activity HflC (stomatin/prohibitin superfamily)
MRGLAIVGVVVVLGLMLWGFIWLGGSSNVETPAGYVGYVTQGSVFGETKFIGTQVGPTSSGKTWLYRCANIDVTPFTYTEDFSGNSGVLTKENLLTEFRSHIIFRIKRDNVKEFAEQYATGLYDHDADWVVQTAYDNYIKEPHRTLVRDAIQSRGWEDVKVELVVIGESVCKKLQEEFRDTPFEIEKVVVGNVQFPLVVSNQVAVKIATKEELNTKETRRLIAEKDAEIRLVEAKGIANAMNEIQSKLTDQYLAHEAIEAQKLMVNSPNNTIVYIPVGNLGVPQVGVVKQ